MRERINFAISGCGNIAMRHATAAKNYGNLLAVCDEDFEKAVNVAQQFKCTPYKSLTEMLSKENQINVVSICTPNYLHSPQSIECLKNGFHVLCEKPMAIKTIDAEQMIAAARDANRELFIVKQLRYYPRLKFLKELISGNSLGRIYSFHINCFWHRSGDYYKSWKGNKLKDGGTLFTQFSHYVDLLLWLFGDVEKFQFTSANLAHPGIEFEDCGLVNLKMRNGSIGSLNFSVNAFKENAENSLTIFAEKGSLKICGPMLNTFEYFKVEGLDNIPEFNEQRTGRDQSHFAVYENVANALTGKSHHALKGFNSICSIRLIEEIYNSLN